MFCRDKRVCRDKTFVATKMILVAAPTSDSNWLSLLVAKGSNSKTAVCFGVVFVVVVFYG